MFVHGVNTDIFYNSLEISLWCDKVDYSGTPAVNETTTFGVAGSAKTYIRGINESKVNISGFVDTLPGTIDAIFATARTATADDVFTYAPSGNTLGNRTKAMLIRDTDLKANSPVNNVVSFTASFQSDGPINEGWSLHTLGAETTTGTSTGVDTGAFVGIPAAPTLTASTTGGTLAAAAYTYRITATNSLGETTAGPEAPTVTTVGTTSSILLTWPPVLSATGYKVYGRTSGAELLMGTVTQPTFTDTGSVTPSGALPGANTAAGSANGGDATAHVTAINGAGTVKVQHSADNITYADLVTVVNAASTTGGYRAAVAVGTQINRYLRDSHTPGTSITFHSNFGRR